VKTSTLFVPREINEAELAESLERQFDAGWLPEHHRCSIDAEGGVVWVDVDAAYVGALPPAELRELSRNLGFVPKTALHISGSKYRPASTELADRVIRALEELLEARVLAAA
jgi:hypothetical protein